MKILKFVAVLFMLSEWQILPGQSQTSCTRYGADDIEYAFQMIRDPDGNFLMTGRTYSFQENPGYPWGDIFTVKVDSTFNIKWTSIFKTPMEDEGNAITNAHGGGYIVAGASYDSLKAYDLTLVKYDTSGNMVWSKLLSSPLNEKIQAIRKISNDCYIVAGYADSMFTGLAQSFVPFVCKIGLNGSVIWAMKFGFSGGVFAGSAYDVIEAPDGSFIVTGDIIREFQGPDDSDMFIARFSSTGSLIWFKWMGNDCQACHEMGACIVPESPQTFTVIGSSTTINGLYGCTIDLNGNILQEWAIPTGYFAYANISAERTVSNGLVITCPVSSGMLALRISNTNVIEWASIHGDGPLNTPCTILQKGSGYVMGGNTGWAGPYREDYVVVEMDSLGYSCCKISDLSLVPASVNLPDSSGGAAFMLHLAEIPAGAAITGGVERPLCEGVIGTGGHLEKVATLSPNPFNDFVNISLIDENSHTVRIYNATGCQMAELTTRGNARIATRHWPEGMYIVLIDGRFVKRVVKL